MGYIWGLKGSLEDFWFQIQYVIILEIATLVLIIKKLNKLKIKYFLGSIKELRLQGKLSNLGREENQKIQKIKRGFLLLILGV